MKVGKENTDGFRRKQVENIEQEACGNNRLPSKAAFDIFVFKKWLIEEKKGKSIFYKLNTITSKKEETSTKNESENQKQVTDKNSQ